MNGRDTKPPDRRQLSNIALQNELILCEKEIKQEPNVKEECESDDEVPVVSRSPINTDSATLDNSISDTALNNSDVYFDFYDLEEVKPEVKIEKVKDEANHGDCKSDQNGDQNHRQQIDPLKRPSNGNNQKPSGSSGGATNVGKKKKANSFGDKKKSSGGKANGKRHKCSSCDYASHIIINLKRHMLKHTGERRFPCNVCQKRFIIKRNLQSHMKIHIDAFLFSCSKCFEGFHRSEDKVKHEIGCKIRRYECHLCKEFSTLQKTKLKRHLRVHTGDRPFECNRCSKKFNQLTHLDYHLKSHAKPRPLKVKCSSCFKNFTQEKEKENHEANCKRRGYRCDVCNSFTTNCKSKLINHMRTHTGEKPFRCEMCSKCFSQKANLIRHQQIHN